MSAKSSAITIEIFADLLRLHRTLNVDRLPPSLKTLKPEAFRLLGDKLVVSGMARWHNGKSDLVLVRTEAITLSSRAQFLLKLCHEKPLRVGQNPIRNLDVLEFNLVVEELLDAGLATISEDFIKPVPLEAREIPKVAFTLTDDAERLLVELRLSKYVHYLARPKTLQNFTIERFRAACRVLHFAGMARFDESEFDRVDSLVFRSQPQPPERTAPEFSKRKKITYISKRKKITYKGATKR